MIQRRYHFDHQLLMRERERERERVFSANGSVRFGKGESPSLPQPKEENGLQLPKTFP